MKKRKNNTSKITKSATLAKILKIKGSEKILNKFNMPCMTCPMAQMEMNYLKIGDVCRMYGLDEKKILEELNKLK